MYILFYLYIDYLSINWVHVKWDVGTVAKIMLDKQENTTRLHTSLLYMLLKTIMGYTYIKIKQ